MTFVRHCIITEEYSGLNTSGGIGVCSNGLANLLIREGYFVDVLITDLSCSAATSLPSKQAGGFPNFTFLSDIAQRDRAVEKPADAITKAYSVYRFLRDKDYIALHFNEWMGTGFYCAMARRQGLLSSKVITHLHGSSEWVRRHNFYFPEIEDYEREGIERSQIENSDLVISPSSFLLEYYREHGVKLPEAKQLNWVLPQWLSNSADLWDAPLVTRAVAPRSISELIYFGRHERRKGFGLFVDAIARLPGGLQPDLTFIGRFDRIGREFSGSYVFRKLPGYPGRIRFLDHLNQDEALTRILHTRSALCVMPSLMENSPCVVGECLTIGAPFLTTEVGGISELIDPASRPHCVVRATPQALAKGIERCMTEGVPELQSAFIVKTVAQNWAQCIKSLSVSRASAPLGGKPSARPLVSVCITHFERPELLSVAIDALMAQTYENIEIIIVDDGSKGTDAHAYLDLLEIRTHRLPVKVIRSENRYLGAARNLAASNAKGQYILFHDDDNVAEPNEIETFVTAAVNSGCDILTCQYWVFRNGEERIAPDTKKIEFFPIGIGGVFSFFRNRFGDANALFRRSVFESLGGYSELTGVGWEDWELFLRAFLRGVKMGIVPEPLFNYRVNPGGMLATGNVMSNFERIFSMVDEEQPRLNADLLRYAQRHAVRQRDLDQLWSELEKSPSSDIHQQLTALEPSSSEARKRLSDLAFAIGRIADALEIGIMDFDQREKILSIVSHLSRPSALTVREKTFIKPSFNGSAPAVALRGWAFVDGGRTFVPRSFSINDKRYETVAYSSFDREDVISHHNLVADQPLGFTLLAVARDMARLDLMRPFRRRRRIPASTNLSIELLDPVDRSFKAHIDTIDWYCEATVEIPDRHSTRARVSIESAVINQVRMKNDVGVYVEGERVSSTIVRFDCPANIRNVSLILPRFERADIIVESFD